jgi:hypothetical protein
MRDIWHTIRGHVVTYGPTIAPIPAIWHNCSCGKRWLS